PHDIDVHDRQYLIFDAKRAVEDQRRYGVATFCLSLDPAADEYVTRIFGARNFMVRDHPRRLPEQLPALYLRLTSCACPRPATARRRVRRLKSAHVLLHHPARAADRERTSAAMDGCPDRRVRALCGSARARPERGRARARRDRVVCGGPAV